MTIKDLEKPLLGWYTSLRIVNKRRKAFPTFAEIVLAVQEIWPWGEVASVEEIESRLAGRWPANLVEAAIPSISQRRCVISGIAFNVTRTVSIIWVNRRTSSDVRATVHSFLSQAESFGEIFGGFALTALVQALGISLVLFASGVVMAITGGMVTWLSTDRVRADE